MFLLPVSNKLLVITIRDVGNHLKKRSCHKKHDGKASDKNSAFHSYRGESIREFKVYFSYERALLNLIFSISNTIAF